MKIRDLGLGFRILRASSPRSQRTLLLLFFSPRFVPGAAIIRWDTSYKFHVGFYLARIPERKRGPVLRACAVKGHLLGTVRGGFCAASASAIDCRSFALLCHLSSSSAASSAGMSMFEDSSGAAAPAAVVSVPPPPGGLLRPPSGTICPTACMITARTQRAVHSKPRRESQLPNPAIVGGKQRPCEAVWRTRARTRSPCICCCATLVFYSVMASASERTRRPMRRLTRFHNLYDEDLPISSKDAPHPASVRG